MKKILLCLFISAFFFESFANTSVAKSLDYIKNDGQWEAPVLYKADLYGGWVFLEKNTLTFKFLDTLPLHHPAKNP